MDQLWEKFIYAKHIMNLFMSNIAKAGKFEKCLFHAIGN